MKVYKRFIILVILVYIIQVSIINLFQSGSLLLNLLLLLSIYINWREQTARVSFITALIGIAADLISPLPFGINMIVFTLIGLSVQYLLTTKLTHQTFGSLVISAVVGYGVYVLLMIIGVKQNYFNILGSFETILNWYTIINGLILGNLALYLIFKYDNQYEEKKSRITI